MRVDLILADRRCYTYEAYAAKHVSRCLTKEQVPHQLIYLNDGALQEYLFYVQQSPPNWTLSFVNLTPHHKPLCDVMGIPHFFWLEGSFSQAMHFLHSSYGKVGVGNQTFCQKLAANNVVFLPHGIEEHMPVEKKLFDVVLFEALRGLSFLKKTWENFFSSAEIAKIERAIQLADPLEAKSYFFYVEQYLNAQKTEQSVRAFKEVRVDVFGEHAGNNWLVQLPQNIHLHSALPFSEYFEVLKASKIAILEPSSQWYLPAIAAGCLPLLPEEEKVKYYLMHPLERESALQKLKTGCLEQSWEQQTKHLIEYMQ